MVQRLIPITKRLGFLAVLVAAANLCAGLRPEIQANEIKLDELEIVKRAEQARIQAIKNVYGSVVAVYGQDRKGGGSGVIFDPAGFALTNHHVVAGAGKTGKAGLADGKLYDWQLVGTDPGGDVAIIKLRGLPKFPASPLGISDRVRIGDWAMAMGNPFILAEDQTPTVTLGIVSGVKRYQYGAGRNTLVYGNCIQVDSSINPGNSGGPLYNMRGEVIGINGRGSFKERGRVNVGVGYAISMKQIRNFVPDLQATKVAQHGTLDALFSNRTDGVICDTINLDSPAALAGLDLGDRLIAFEGESITNANEFTNLISTLPADWPAELTFEREGKQQTIWVRLTPLPYGGQNEPEPEEKPDDEDGPRRIQPRRGGLQLSTEGEIGNQKLNQANTQHILTQWKQHNHLKADTETQGFRTKEAVLRKDVKIGEIKTLLSKDGRFRVDYKEYGVEYACGFDGEDYWMIRPDEAVQKIDPAEILELPLAAHAAVLAALQENKPLNSLGTPTLQGSDKSQRKPCYRLRVDQEKADADSPPLCLLWLTIFDDDGKSQVRLAKSGSDKNGRDPCLVYEDWREVAGSWIPHRRRVAEGLAEESVITITTNSCEPLAKVDDNKLSSPVTMSNEMQSRIFTLLVLFCVIAVAGTSTAEEKISGIFDQANLYAQARCVKIFGASIGRVEGYGTGIIVSPDGHIITASGVMLSGYNIFVVLPDGSRHPAKVQRRSQSLQTAMLKIDAKTPDFFDLPEKISAEQGDWALAVSNCFKVADGKEPLSVNLGVLSLRTKLDTKRGLQAFAYDGDVILIDAITSNPGSAGGAVVGVDGQLIGMVGRTIESVATNTRLNYAIPADLLFKFQTGRPLNEDVAEAPKGGDPYVGIRVFSLGVGRRALAYIDRVKRGSPADEAGLQADDLIVAVGQQSIQNIREYKEVEKTLTVGEEIIFIVKRKDQLLQISVTPSVEE